jgi:hypothetical protein
LWVSICKLLWPLCFAYGVAFGVLKIAWIVLTAVYLYDISVKTGQFEIMKELVAEITAASGSSWWRSAVVLSSRSAAKADHESPGARATGAPKPVAPSQFLMDCRL